MVVVAVPERDARGGQRGGTADDLERFGFRAAEHDGRDADRGL
ncbi:hypothetical protein [Planomonospora sp. ID67723]|nr:hypothetical protein [Planomonospora sp. ID67723]